MGNILFSLKCYIYYIALKIVTIIGTKRPNILIGLPAVGPDFATWPSEQWTKVPHFHHCIGKISLKTWRVADIAIYLRISGSSIEKLLIWVQETLLALQILEVSIVKGGRGAVKRSQISVTTNARTICLQRCCKRGIYVGVVVNPCSESWTTSLPNCVPSWNCIRKWKNIWSAW